MLFGYKRRNIPNHHKKPVIVALQYILDFPSTLQNCVGRKQRPEVENSITARLSMQVDIRTVADPLEGSAVESEVGST
jgi:hypothetical protein